VELKDDAIFEKFAGFSTHDFSSDEALSEAVRTRGARVIPSPRTTLVAPPAFLIAVQPRLVEASKAPSVVAMGTLNCLSSNMSGPTMPTGRGMYPITASQFVLTIDE
jgi:hypothetical protein